MSQYTNSLALPEQISHIGVVVKDIDETTKFLATMWGLTSWEIFDYKATQEKIIFGEPFGLRLAYTKLGSTRLELIQPSNKNSIWAGFLRTHGEGIHHISYDVPRYDEMVTRLQEHGCLMLVSAYNDDGTRWCYFETKPAGMIIEFEEL